MEAYFNYKYTMEMIGLHLLITVLAIVVIWTVINLIYSSIRENRIHKFFTSHGYERKLLDVSLVGGHAFWGWVRELDHTVVDDRDIRSMSLRQIKIQYR